MAETTLKQIDPEKLKACRLKIASNLALRKPQPVLNWGSYDEAYFKFLEVLNGQQDTETVHQSTSQ